MSQKVLCVDDDPNILDAYKRGLRKQFDLETAIGPEAALQAIEHNGPYAVIVSDMQMPGMSGVEFLERARELTPDTVRMMLTGNADVRTAVEAVHRGCVFRFLVKPCPPESLAMAIDAALAQYGLVTAERDLLEKTLRGTIRVLMEILSVIDPELFGRAQTMRQSMRTVATAMGLKEIWKLELAAMLSQIGMVSVPAAVLNKCRAGQPLERAEKEQLRRVPEYSHDLLVNIPRLEDVAKTILYQKKHFDGTGLPDDKVAGEQIPIGARILRVLLDQVQLEMHGAKMAGAYNIMQKRDGWYDPNVLATMISCFAQKTERGANVWLSITFDELSVGQVIAVDLEAGDGVVLVKAGSEVTQNLIDKLDQAQSLRGIKEPIYVTSSGPAKRLAA